MLFMGAHAKQYKGPFIMLKATIRDEDKIVINIC